VVRNLLTRDRRVTESDDTTERPAVEERTTERRLRREPTTEPITKETAETPPRWFRTSSFATLGLMVGLVGLAATLTGLLAPVGVAVGVVGGAIAAGGLIGASRRGRTGHSVALLGMVFSLAAIVLGVLAMSGHLSWLNSSTDEVARARDWLNSQFPWMKNW
jgi:hypothetical protein